MTPDEKDLVERMAQDYKDKFPDKIIKKEEALNTIIGRGLILITSSMLKYWYGIS